MILPKNDEEMVMSFIELVGLKPGNMLKITID